MVLREAIRNLVRDLRDDDAELVQSSLADARYLLQQSERRHVKAPGGPLLSEYNDLLPEEYVGVRLSDDEVDAVVDAIVRLIDAPPGLAGSAAWALTDSARFSMVPRLTDLLRRYATQDAWITKQAAFAVSHILMSRGTPDARAITGDQSRVVEEAIAALRHAAVVGITQGAWDGREAAQAELDWISRRFDLAS